MQRLGQIEQFLKNHDLADAKFEKIAGDASFRSYYRVFQYNKSDLILMDAPPDLEDIKPFIKIDKILRDNGFLAPEIFAIDEEKGFLLLQDFGKLSYNKALKDPKSLNFIQNESKLYKKASDVLINLHKIQIEADLPLYDEELLMKEVMLFIDWYLPHIANNPANSHQIAEFQKSFQKLFNKLSQDKILVLRDYHADNLFVVDEEVGLIDFQDGVLGSCAYDLVSLLEDARRDVSKPVVDEVIAYYLEKSNCDKEQFLLDYEILSLQRNVKIVGIFSRLAIRDGKEEYLKFLPKMFAYIKTRLSGGNFTEIRNFFNNFNL